ncbi:DUF3305 domain-containing protein [Roseococcus sp. DSY-14]|uniref:DUF3305 domain-containing protein n=1 Tax=Roseococcus sp. DSY-14 TaxID=3369650 RepID=UPI00387AC448
MIPPELTLPVAVLVESRPGATVWQDRVWRPLSVQEEAPPVPAWTKLREEEGRETWFAGEATLTLHRTDTPNYRDNLAAAAPRLWVLLRPAGEGVELAGATVDPGEAEIWTEGPRDILEALPMPAGIRALLEAFVAEHHVEQVFHKRKRDRLDPEALSRRSRA